jgi:Zn ribbon nucleic-acid-binding protein
MKDDEIDKILARQQSAVDRFIKNPPTMLCPQCGSILWRPNSVIRDFVTCVKCSRKHKDRRSKFFKG